jgi:hypothetical protein
VSSAILTELFGTNLMKHCSGHLFEKLFLKYFPIHTLSGVKRFQFLAIFSFLGLVTKVAVQPYGVMNVIYKLITLELLATETSPW